MEYIIIAIIAYLIGSINFSILISKKKAGYDIRQKGSGNAGTTNMLRNLGKKYAAITLICDVLKGVATSLGILLMTNWQLGLICLVFALVLMALTRVVSMGSIAAAILYPILTLFVGGGHYIVESSGLGNGYFIYSVILAIIVIFNHRENIKRILSGTENKISFNK